MASISPRPTPIRASLTAAASRRQLKAGQSSRDIRQEGWQSRMWHFYRHLGAVHYGVNFKKNAAAKVRYFAAEKMDHEPDPIETENQQVIDTLARLKSRYGDLNEIIAEFMVHLNVPGEGYLVGTDGLEGEEWDVWSIAEVQAAANAAMPLPDQAVTEGDAYMARIWRPDPEHRHLADSPLQPVTDQCEQLLLLDDSVKAAASSRLPAGLLLLPSELDFPDFDAFQDEVIEVLTTPIRETDSAARYAPGMIRGSAEYLKEIRILSFAREMDETFAAMREELTRAIAAGLDLPAEIVTGMGDMTHWNAWLLDESAFRDHIDPDIILIMDSITRGFLHPALQEMGVEDFERYLIWRDLSDLGQRPPTIPEATAMWDRGIVGNDYMLGLINATEDDAPLVAPTPGEPVPAVGEGIARGEPGQSQALGVTEEPLAQRVNAAGILIRSGFDPEASLAALGLPAIAHLGYLPVTIKTDVPPDPAAAVLDPNAPEPEEKKPVQETTTTPFPAITAAVTTRPLTELAKIDRMLLARITEASEAGFNRVLERAGAKIRSHAKKDRAISATIDRIPNDQVTYTLGETLTRQLQITPQDLVPDDSFDPLQKRLRTIMAGAQEEVAVQLEAITGERPEPDPRKVQSAIAAFLSTLAGFALGMLFKPQEPGPGEVGDSVIPPKLVVDMMTQAAGATPSDGPSNVRGFATGQDSVQWLDEHGVKVVAHEWEYGNEGTRKQPFPPHRRLDGVQFSDWTDEQLATPASASFLSVSHMFPGDHFRCQCMTIPVAVEPPEGHTSEQLEATNTQRLSTANRPGIDDNPDIVRAARERFEYAMSREGEISRFVDPIARDTNATFQHYGERVKFEASLRDKIWREMQLDPSLTARQAAERITDTNRYTFQWDANSQFRMNHARTVRAFNENGWETIADKNAWAPGDAYDGMNYKFQRGADIVEVQFHTPASAVIKDQSHILYSQARIMPPGPAKEQLLQQVLGLWNRYRSHVPPGMEMVGTQTWYDLT